MTIFSMLVSVLLLAAASANAREPVERGWLFDGSVTSGYEFLDKTGQGRILISVYDFPDTQGISLNIDCNDMYLETNSPRKQSVLVRIGDREASYRVEIPEPYILEFRARDAGEIIERMAEAARQGVTHVRFDGKRYSLKNFLDARAWHRKACASKDE